MEDIKKFVDAEGLEIALRDVYGKIDDKADIIYVDSLIGDINTILASVVGGGS